MSYFVKSVMLAQMKNNKNKKNTVMDVRKRKLSSAVNRKLFHFFGKQYGQYSNI